MMNLVVDPFSFRELAELEQVNKFELEAGSFDRLGSENSEQVPADSPLLAAQA